jgi:curved DNA-binding protein CbpA
MNPFKILEIPDNSDIKICERAYRTLVLKYHPDRGGNPEKFREISEAISKIRNGYSNNNSEQGSTTNFYYQSNGDLESMFKDFSRWYYSKPNREYYENRLKARRQRKKELEQELVEVSNDIVRLEEKLRKC